MSLDSQRQFFQNNQRKGIEKMSIAKKILIATAVPALAFAVTVEAADKKAPAKAPVKAPAAVAAPAKPAAKTFEQALAFLPPVIAEGKGIKITKKDFIKEISMQIPESALSQIPEAQLKPIIKNMINGMVDRELIFGIAQKNGYKASPRLVQDEFDKMLKQLPKENLKQLEAQLKMQGKTVDAYKNEIAKDPMAQKGAAFAKYMKEKIEPQCKVTDAEAEKFYRENQKNFQIPEEITASHILIRPNVPAGKEKDKAAVAKADKDALAKAQTILAKLKQGADFGKLAEQESACPSGKSAKGSLGKFKRGMMVPEFDKAAFALKKGELSPVVKTQFGYHIIKLADKTPASYQSFDKVKSNIRNYLAAPKVEKILKAQIAKERTALNVKIANF